MTEKEEILHEVAYLYEKANRMEKSINWNNDEERDSALQKLGQLILDANWKIAKVYNNSKGV